MDIDRKLATFRTVSRIEPIEGADRIEVAFVDGWQVVVKKGEFKEGDTGVYFEIDSWIPHKIAPFLSNNREPKEYKGIKGERLKTIKLKGTLSQGLLLPLSAFPFPNCFKPDMGADLTDYLGILKWEKEIPAQLRGQVKGNFPSFLFRTDQERVQNCYQEHKDREGGWEITEKLDGSSMTVYLKDGVFGVCSRNLDLKKDENNAFWKVAIKSDIEEDLIWLNKTTGHEFAFQGELLGPGVQGNPYKLDELKFFLFDIFNITKQKYMTPAERINFVNDSMVIGHVPLIEFNAYTQGLPSLEELLEEANGLSDLWTARDVRREGIVFKNMQDPSKTFKVISNEWLLNEK